MKGLQEILEYGKFDSLSLSLYTPMRKHFKVPVLAYLKKYLEKQFFPGEQAPYKIEEDSLIGKQFMSLLIDQRTKELMGDQKLLHSETLEVELSEAMAERSPNLRKLGSINYFLDKLFKDALIVWIKSAEIHGGRPYPASKAFLEYFNIDESEYSHDAAYKVWTRYKAEQNDKISPQRRTKLTASVSSR
jgi:hypothetical protein